MLKHFHRSLNDRNIRVLIVFACSLLVFNIAFISSGGWARLAWNSLGYILLFVTYKAEYLTLSSIGLAKNKLISGFKYGLFIIGIIAAAMLLLFLIDKSLFQDTRYRQSLLTAVYSVLIYLPLKTVLFEEITFRGLLPAIALKIKNQQRFAALLSSIMFGLWHIFSAIKMGDYAIGNLVVPNFLVVVAVFTATSAAGYLLYELRVRSDSLIAPIIVHWFLNAFGILLAYFALQ